jgi:nitrate reductase gamma subunit
LIFGFMIILGVVGNVWLVAGGALGLVVIGVTWLMIRRRAGKRTNAGKDAIKG